MPRDAPTALVRHVDKIWGKSEDAALIEAAEAVETALSGPGYQAVKRVLDAELESLDRRLDGDSILEQAEYARLLGRRGAIRAYEGAAQAIIIRSRERFEVAERSANAAGESAAEG